MGDGHTERVEDPPPGADRDPTWSPDGTSESANGTSRSAIPPQGSTPLPSSPAVPRLDSPWVGAIDSKRCG